MSKEQPDPPVEDLEDWLLPAGHPLLDEVDEIDPIQGDPATYFCYKCGTPWQITEIQCRSCGHWDRALSEARPLIEVVGDTAAFSGPWELLPWPNQGTVVMFGGPGAGKSSLAGLIRPTLWMTKEQEPKPVGAMFRRLLGTEYMPRVVVVDTADEVEHQLQLLKAGPVVLDSLTALGLREGLKAAHVMVRWARENNDRCLAIAQVNKGEQLAGYNEIPHLFDAVVNVTPDPWGVRAFRVTKSRWSPLDSVYWTFNKEGVIGSPDFAAAYSVEGEPGLYWLHPFPMKGATWNGLLAQQAGDECLEPGSACSAIRASYMPNGFLQPNDVHERRRFAERHGLTWIDPAHYASPSEEGEE